MNENDKFLWKKAKSIGGKRNNVKFKLNDNDTE